MNELKKIFFIYQNLMWYAGQARGEYAKLGSFIPETLMIITYFTVRGIDIKIWHIPLAYLAIMMLAVVIGKFLVVIGVAKYNATLGNTHNPELQKILTILEDDKRRKNNARD